MIMRNRNSLRDLTTLKKNSVAEDAISGWQFSLDLPGHFSPYGVDEVRACGFKARTLGMFLDIEDSDGYETHLIALREAGLPHPSNIDNLPMSPLLSDNVEDSLAYIEYTHNVSEAV